MLKYVRVVPHNVSWAELYQEEAQKLARVFGDELLSIHHFGSTSIPEIHAKPILDILVEVWDINRVEQFNIRMAELGYEAMGEFGLPGRRFFVKGGNEDRTHNVHAFQTGDPEIERCLNFRDYMLTHPAEAQAYSDLKDELAHEYPEDIQSYNLGKDRFIKERIRRAAIWREETRRPGEVHSSNGTTQ